MFKRFALFFVFLFIVGSVFSFVTIQPKYVSVSKDKWTQVTQYDDNNYVITRKVELSPYPSFIVTKKIEYTKMGYLISVWVASNTRIDDRIGNISITDVSILYGDKMQEKFQIKFIVIGATPTQVGYFFVNNPDADVKLKWKNIQTRW